MSAGGVFFSLQSKQGLWQGKKYFQYFSIHISLISS